MWASSVRWCLLCIYSRGVGLGVGRGGGGSPVGHQQQKTVTLSSVNTALCFATPTLCSRIERHS